MAGASYHSWQHLHGAGLGLRRPLMDALRNETIAVNFIEFAPENWMGTGGRAFQSFEAIMLQYPAICHGLSLSLGGPDPIDIEFVRNLKHFFQRYNIQAYSEHLSYSSSGGHLYDLLPIPFTEEAIHYVANRVAQVQDLLEMRIALENISYYATPGQTLSEIEFITGVLGEADCLLLLDVNNVYVNSMNHGYDAIEFIRSIPRDRVAYYHIAGHQQGDLIIDTHGQAVIDAVWKLLEISYQFKGVKPTLLERDSNFNSLVQLDTEIQYIKSLQCSVDCNESAHA